MIPNLSELVRDMLLSLCCYGDEGRGDWVRHEKKDLLDKCLMPMLGRLITFNGRIVETEKSKTGSPYPCAQIKRFGLRNSSRH